LALAVRDWESLASEVAGLRIARIVSK
jgi:hypothetical protein